MFRVSKCDTLSNCLLGLKKKPDSLGTLDNGSLRANVFETRTAVGS